MKALLLNKEVVDVQAKEFEVPSTMSWVDCSNEVKIGWVLKDGNLVDPDVLTADEQAAVELRELRRIRDTKLVETDWWGVSENTITSAQTTYRQALRDITKTYSSINDDGFAWPTKPEGGE